MGGIDVPGLYPGPWHMAENMRVSRTVSAGLCRSFWPTYCAVRTTLNSSNAWPLYVMLPVVGTGAAPQRAFMSMLLPPPGGPTRSVIVPGRKAPETLCSILTVCMGGFCPVAVAAAVCICALESEASNSAL